MPWYVDPGTLFLLLWLLVALLLVPPLWPSNQESTRMEPKSESMGGRSGWQRFLEFVEQPLFLVVISIVGGIVGVILYAPVFLLCDACLLLALHRSKAVADKRFGINIAAYGIVFLVATTILFGVGALLRNSARNFIQTLASAVAEKVKPGVPTQPATTGATEGQKPPESHERTPTASEIAKEVWNKAPQMPDISFTNKTSVLFHHGLHTRAPHIECFNDKGEDLKTWDGPKVIDQDTIEYKWSAPVTGSCTATGGGRYTVTPSSSKSTIPALEPKQQPAPIVHGGTAEKVETKVIRARRLTFSILDRSHPEPNLYILRIELGTARVVSPARLTMEFDKDINDAEVEYRDAHTKPTDLQTVIDAKAINITFDGEFRPQEPLILVVKAVEEVQPLRATYPSASEVH
jgi:hypothetical protein